MSSKKLRGLARRSRQRRVTLTIYPHAQVEYADGRLTMHMLSIGGSHRVEHRVTHDGLGRQVGLYETTITKGGKS